MNNNKQSIEKEMAALRVAVQMEADIREVIEKFKHYKQVNSKFIDAVKAKGYYAYICKDKFSTKLVISANNHNIDYSDRVDFTIYVSEFMERNPITWEKIESELVRYGFQARLDKVFQMSKYFEIEKVRFKELCEFMEKLEYKCFDLYEVKRLMRNALEYAEKE